MKSYLSFALCGALLCSTYTPTKSQESWIPQEPLSQQEFLDALGRTAQEGLLFAAQLTIGVGVSLLLSWALIKIMNEYIVPKDGRFTILKAGTIKESFASVAGNDAAKEELKDIVSYLQDPSAYHEIGALVPKGILLAGPSGTGKTLLARALAGEIGCAFISVSGSSFVEMFLGSSIANVRKLFKAARSLNAPCIIFIDEIDAVIAKRISDGQGGTEEINRMVNEFLQQLDGFDQHPYPIIIIGATNRIQAIDKAALRPGRFDRIVHVKLPNLEDRKKIIALHLKKIKHNGQLDLKPIVEKTGGFSGADLANLINESAIIALKKGQRTVAQIDLETALAKAIQRK